MEEKEITQLKYKVAQEDKNTIFEKVDEKIWIYSNIFVIFLIIFSIIIAFLSTISEVYKNFFYILFWLDFIISILFWLEYFYRLKHSKNKKKFIFNIFNM